MKNRTIDLEDPLQETQLDDSFFLGYRETSRDQLPIHKRSKSIIVEKDILYCIEQHSLTVLIAETGSGKTTRKYQTFHF